MKILNIKIKKLFKFKFTFRLYGLTLKGEMVIIIVYQGHLHVLIN
jgi:hypothetical protein